MKAIVGISAAALAATLLLALVVSNQGGPPPAASGEVDSTGGPVPSALSNEPQIDVVPGDQDEAGISNSAGTALAESPAAGTSNDGDRVWPIDAETMESVVLQELLGSPVENLQILSSECSETVCEIRYVLDSRQIRDLAGPDSFAHTFASPPYDAHYDLMAVRHGPNEFTMRISTTPPPDLSEEEIAANRRQRASEFRRAAQRVLPSSESPSDPIAFRVGSRELIVENVCSVDCPLDTKQIIHLQVQEGRTCFNSQGVEEVLLVRTSEGRFEERRFCVPAVLTEE